MRAMRFPGRQLVVAAFALGALPVAADPIAAGAPAHSIGLAITGWHIAMADPLDPKTECPDGLVVSNDAEFKAQFPDPAQRTAWLARYASRANRGPHGGNMAYFPETAQDPLPYREVRGTAGQGFDLDGGKWGQGPAQPLQHEKFVSPSGEHVDNQLYRAVGCQMGWRKSGLQEEDSNRKMSLDPNARILIEIDNVRDEQNDPDVTVTIMKGLDRLVQDSSGKFIPFLTQREDAGLPWYISRTHGKIVDGTLITDPIDAAKLPVVMGGEPHERLMRSFRLKLKLDDRGATGLAGGYEDLADLWIISTRPYAAVFEIGSWSGPGYWAALHRLADGYPDPVTGQATAISAAYVVEAVRCFIVDAPQPSLDEPLDAGRLVAASAVGGPAQVAAAN